MIGMSQIKRKFYTGLGIGLGVAVVLVTGVSVYSFFEIESYKKGENKYYIENYTKEISVTNQSIMQGQTVTNDMLQKTRVHINMAPKGYVNSVGENMVAKYNIANGMPLTYEMLAEELIDEDVRETEVSTILMPTNLVEGKYVDIRIKFANGTDYVVLPEVQVKRILNTTMWFDFNEYQRSIITSAEVDSYLNDGASLYAIEYVDETQIVKAQENVKDVVKGELEKLIEAELPELYTKSYDEAIKEVSEDSSANTEKTTDDKATTEKSALDTTEDVSKAKSTEQTSKEENNTTTNNSKANVSAQKADIIYDFIVKYRNLVASTTNTVATYQPTSIITTAMRANPNIVKEAKEKLNAEVRAAIEALNNRAADEYGKDQSKLVSGANAAINTQKSLRSSVMAE